MQARWLNSRSLVHPRPLQGSEGMARFCRGSVRLLLVLSMWHAPLPCVHTHDIVGPFVEHVLSLARHVDHFHLAEVEHGQRHLGWHVHLVLPWNASHATEGPTDDLSHIPHDLPTHAQFAVADAGSSAQPLLRTVELLPAQPGLVEADLLTTLTGHAVREVRSRGDLTDPVPVQDRLCIYRC